MMKACGCLAALLVVLAASYAPASLATQWTLVPDWQQCGGTSNCVIDGISRCADASWMRVACSGPTSSCQRANQWHWQCVPGTASNNNQNNNNQNGNSNNNGGGKVLAQWGQCGGRGGECQQLGGCSDAPFPGTSCPSGQSCQKQDQWYWQCKPGDGSRASGSGSSDVIYVEKSASSRAMGGGVGCQPLQLWERCGGKNMGPSDAPHPGYCCPSGSSCSRDNEWHWQCKPGNSNGGNNGNIGGQQSTVPIEFYFQCGGQKGWACDKGTQCSDAPWPGHSCPAQGQCRRQTADYWQCRPFVSTDSNPNNPNQNNNQNGNSNNNGGGKVLAQWGQCGGRGGECQQLGGCSDAQLPGTSCPSGQSCQKQDQWYWQCKPGGGSRSAGSDMASEDGGDVVEFADDESGSEEQNVIYVEKSALSRAVGGGCQPLQLWDMCGGKNLGGADAASQRHCCPSGTTCTKDNEWYWQCRPGGNGGSTNSGTSGSSNGGQSSQSTVKIEFYHQCGGQKGWACDKGTQCSDAPWPGHSCPAEGHCKRQTADYWQCRPFITTGSLPTIEKWQQCGGKGGECGKYSCQDTVFQTAACVVGSKCVRHSEWYWQCM